MMNKTMQKAMPANPKQVGILGVFPFAGISAEIIEHGLEHLEKDGYKPVFLESLEDIGKFDASKLELNWVVTASGLPTAQYLEKEKGIPYVAAFPVGMKGMRQWRVHLAKLLGYEDTIEIPAGGRPVEQAPKVLLIGDPVLTAGMKNYFQDILGYKQVVRAHYAPLDSVKEWFDRILLRAEGHGLQTEQGELSVNGSVAITNEAVLEELQAEADIIIGDISLKPKKGELKQRWVNLPDCLSSCGLEKSENYQLFGKKGAAWLGERLAIGD